MFLLESWLWCNDEILQNKIWNELTEIPWKTSSILNNPASLDFFSARFCQLSPVAFRLVWVCLWCENYLWKWNHPYFDAKQGLQSFTCLDCIRVLIIVVWMCFVLKRIVIHHTIMYYVKFRTTIWNWMRIMLCVVVARRLITRLKFTTVNYSVDNVVEP